MTTTTTTTTSPTTRLVLVASPALLLATTLLLASPGRASGADDAFGPGFQSQKPSRDDTTKSVVHRVVGTTFRKYIVGAPSPYLVAFCDGPCFDAERGLQAPLRDIAEMMAEKKSGRVAQFNYALNDLEKGLEHYRDAAKDDGGRLPPTFLAWAGTSTPPHTRVVRVLFA